jgi:hypothetical protein
MSARRVSFGFTSGSHGAFGARPWAPALALALGLGAAVGPSGCSKDPAQAKPTSALPAPSGQSASTGVPPGAAMPADRAGAPTGAGKARVEGKGFIVEVKSPEDAAAGAESTTHILLTATSGYHLNKEFPTQLNVTAPAGVTAAKTEFTLDDAAAWEEKKGRFDVKFVPKAGGEQAFSATFRFAVCTETTCDPKTETLAWSVPVKAAP